MGSEPQRAVDVARRLIRQLRGFGVVEAVLSPGSRSAALALALHAADEQGLIRLHVRVDEREAGFVALGLAKASGMPVPVVTTSGTAVANLHPAMLEAQHARVPVIAVTADRPARLHGTGANQTTIQAGIFGPLIETIDRVGALRLNDGPIHLNLELDEPLVEDVEWEFRQMFPVAQTREPATPLILDGTLRTMVVAGDGAGPAARHLAETAGWPLLAEPSSGSRAGSHLVPGQRLALLARPDVTEQIEQVVSFGHPTLSRPVTALLAMGEVRRVHVGDQWTFPVAATSVEFAEVLEVEGRCEPDWLTEWREAGTEVLEHIEEPRHVVARTICESVGDGDLLYVGASTTIRDLDLVGGGINATVLANRGLAGIDGTLSSAIGAALALSPRRAIAYVGDLTFLHGSNGLLIGPGEPRPDLTIVVLNDDGGGIFTKLEQAGEEYAGAFARVFTTPTGADLGSLCRGFSARHRRVEPEELADALSTVASGIEVIEVGVPPMRRAAPAS